MHSMAMGVTRKSGATGPRAKTVKDHCALYGSTGVFVTAHAAALKDYDLSKGTIRFSPGKPLPMRLLTKMIRARVAEIEGSDQNR